MKKHFLSKFIPFQKQVRDGVIGLIFENLRRNKFRMKSLKIFFLLFFAVSSTQALDIYDEIANAIRSGDSKQIAVYFGTSVDLTIINQEDVYSKAQAELIIKDFFSKNTPKSFSILHKGASKEGTLYSIGNLTTLNNKTFRVSFFMKMAGGKYLIQELRFETE